MNFNGIKRGRSQIMFRYLPGAIFFENKRWYKVDNLVLNKITEETSHLMYEVRKFVDSWKANNDLSSDLYPNQNELYLFGEIQQVVYNLFPTVFRCEVCQNVHEYYNLDDIQRKNPELKCKFCTHGYLTQYPYALLHPNGDIQSINVKVNPGSNSWKEKYQGIKMNDTRRFTTATWFNSKKNIQLGYLGTKTTNRPLTQEMIKENKRFLGGTHLSDGDVFYPAIRSIVNLKRDRLVERTRNPEFPYIQFAALLELSSINKNVFSDNFLQKNNDNPLLTLLENAEDPVQKEMLLKMIKQNNLEEEIHKKTYKDEISIYFNEDFEFEKISNDRLLHEFIFSWFENQGKSIQEKVEEAQELNDSVQETTLLNGIKELKNLGFESAKLLEKFPVVTMGIGFTRKSFDRAKAVLNPFNQTINNRKHSIIPVLKNENEAIIFKLDPLRVFAWIKVNNLIDDSVTPRNKAEAHSILYDHLNLGSMDVDELSHVDFDTLDNNLQFASILTFQLIHTQMHTLLSAGKSILGLDVDSMSEYIFPSALAGAIYVSKLQGGGMGTLIAAFDNDMERWLRNTYEKSQICIYDPICKGQRGACHACSYLKFSCQCFNRGLSRNLIIGGNVGKHLIKGYLSKEVDEYLQLLYSRQI